jgi:hypothetical protein
LSYLEGELLDEEDWNNNLLIGDLIVDTEDWNNYLLTLTTNK